MVSFSHFCCLCLYLLFPVFNAWIAWILGIFLANQDMGFSCFDLGFGLLGT
jgi:hypothetical protein